MKGKNDDIAFYILFTTSVQGKKERGGRKKKGIQAQISQKKTIVCSSQS